MYLFIIFVRAFHKKLPLMKKDQSERTTFASLASHLSSTNFVKNLALKYDLLQEPSVLSQELQANTINIQSAHSNLMLLRQLLVSRKQRKGKYELKVSQDENGIFKNVSLTNQVRGVCAINRNQLIQSLINKLDEKVFTNVTVLFF